MLNLPLRHIFILNNRIYDNKGQHGNHNEHIDNNDPFFLHCAFCSPAFSSPHESAYLPARAVCFLGLSSVLAYQQGSGSAQWATILTSLLSRMTAMCRRLRAHGNEWPAKELCSFAAAQSAAGKDYSAFDTLLSLYFALAEMSIGTFPSGWPARRLSVGTPLSDDH